MDMNKQIVFVPEIAVSYKTDTKIHLSSEIQVLVLLTGDFVHFMNTGREEDGIQLLPYIGRLITYAGLPPIFQELICNQRPISLN